MAPRKKNYMRTWLNENDVQMFSGKLPQLGPDIESKPVPAPTGGWDAISPLSGMPPEYAVVLDNAVPRPGWVELRGGSAVWEQRFATGPVETLFVYRPPSGVEQLLAAVDGEIWNISTRDSPVQQEIGFTSDRWQYVNFTPAGGAAHLIAVNGEDDAQIYNGTTWAAASITGVALNTLLNVNAHKRRVWFIEKDSTSAWYLATDAIAGAATEFELGSLLTKGGYLVAMGTWTVDGGNGPDDLAVFVSSKGQAIVYRGTDPGNSSAWFLVGVFNLPPPIGVRCLQSFGSDLLYISTEGLLPISKALPFDPSGVRSVALTNRILNAMLTAAQLSRTFFGWEVELFPSQSLLLMNVPLTEGALQVQYVMNTLTGAWCRFTGWNANTFAIFNESLYYGNNNGSVILAYAGVSDVISAIAMDIKTAFNYYDDPGRVKDIRMVRPFTVAGGSISPTIGLDVDFGDVDFVAPTSVYLPSGSLWDEALWDVDEWGGTSTGAVQNDWQSIGGIGTAIALRIKANVIGEGAGGFDTAMFDFAQFNSGVVPAASGDNLPILQINSFQITMEHGAAV